MSDPALTADQLYTLRRSWIYDYYDGSTNPPSYESDFNLVTKNQFFSDPDLQAVYLSVIAENPKLYLEYTDNTGATQSPLTVDPVNAFYHEMRKKCWQRQLVSTRFIKAMHNGGTSDDIVNRVLDNMKDAIRQDVMYRINTGQFPQALILQRY